MSKVIPFNVPLVLGTEQTYVSDAIKRKEFSGGGYYTKLCESKLQEITQAQSVLLTSSCTHALEMCAILLDIKEGDEVIMASYNFVSAANAFVLRGAKVVFVDIREDTLNIDEGLIEEAISPKTKVILAMHYGGVPCNMNKIMSLADQYNLFVVEDAAHCIGSFSNKNHLGTIGHLGALSFHATKNVHCGEGGVLLINDERFIERAHVIREKGTNRKQFVEGKVQKYTWVDIGSSYLLGELSAAFLYAQLQKINTINTRRIAKSKKYKNEICDNFSSSSPQLIGNGHVFYILTSATSERDVLIDKLINLGIYAYFHYIPLHKSTMSENKLITKKDMSISQRTSDNLIRLPLYYDLSIEQQRYIIQSINSLNNENY